MESYTTERNESNSREWNTCKREWNDSDCIEWNESKCIEWNECSLYAYGFISIEYPIWAVH